MSLDGSVRAEEAAVLPTQVRCVLTWDHGIWVKLLLLEMMICTHDFAFQSLILPLSLTKEN